MPKRQKCSSCSSGWCKNHLFELIPNLSSLYFRKIQKVRLCPRFNKTTKNFQIIVPQVNKDKKYYTPSFILDEERSFYVQNDKKMLQNHEEKIEEMVQGNTDSIVKYFQLCFRFVAKHGRKRKYCSVCHNEYEDYLQHINDINHKEKINKNKYTSFIKQMGCQYLKSRTTAAKQGIKTESVQQTEDHLKIKNVSEKECQRIQNE